MWPDNETERDFLNFEDVAGTVAELIVQSNGRPVSIGVSGAWGSGKSSMVRLIRKSLQSRDKTFVFVEFNAWLYQGYDDARAALLETVANALDKEAQQRETSLDKVKDLLERIDWLRATKLLGGSALAMAMGLPPVGLLGELWQLVAGVRSGKPQETAKIDEVAAKAVDSIPGLIKAKTSVSPSKQIQSIRESFEQLLEEMKVKLVVLVDDLDRCLPSTAISTLEAIRLLLFLRNTAFVIAADDQMIKHAVREHFGGIEEDLATSYFDKLIQIPIRVPPLGIQEVRAYMMLLFIENSSLPQSAKDSIRMKVCEQLGKAWSGVRVDRAFVTTICKNLPPELVSHLDAADRLAPLMASSPNIAGNPRLIKRFLNTLSIRMTISTAHGVGVDEAVLTKMLLFERCAPGPAYLGLVNAINNDTEGKPRFLLEWESKACVGEELDLSSPWTEPFIREWLAVPPSLADIDLRGVLYVSREQAPLISATDRLSSEAAGILAAILKEPVTSSALIDRMRGLSHHETTVLMDRVLDRARQEQEWGTPPILDACLAVTDADPTQSSRLAAFLRQRPPQQIKPSIVPRLRSRAWAKEVFIHWKGLDVRPAVKKAMEVET